MIQRKAILGAVVGALALTGMVRADMMSISPPGSLDPPPPQVRVAAEGQAMCPSDMRSSATVADHVQTLLARRAPDWEGTVEQTGEIQPVQVLSDRQSSLSLCLYSLLGLGLFRSAPFVKKLSFGIIPSWYYEGGPRQIGPSLAITPDCLCSAPLCFVQPEGLGAPKIPRYHFPSVVSRWRRSQFTPAVIASRAPPSLS